ncbi:MAG: hypothetical protein ABLQ96_13110, partial [Candidatus Acidiferrum sp.]
AHVAALFIKFFPRELSGVFAPEMLPPEMRRAIVAGMRAHSVRITHKTTALRAAAEDDEDI